MNTAVIVEPLARHRTLLPLVARWFTSEWPGWYGPGGRGDVSKDLEAFAASEQNLPVGLLVFEHGVPIGAAALKAESIATHTNLSPWAGAGFVLPEFRGRGIGSILLAELVVKARELGYQHVYCGTSTSESLLVRAGWAVVELTQHEGETLTIFSRAASRVTPAN